MSHDPEAGRKLRTAIEEYSQRQDLSRFTQPTALDAVLACFVPEEATANQIRSLTIDLVFRYLFAAARNIYDEVQGNADLFNQHLEHYLKRRTRLTPDNVLYFQKHLKQAVLTSVAERPKNEVRDKLLRKQRDKHCYICGTAIQGTDDERLDHVWPHSAGGGTGRSNLLRAHAECEAAKGDLATPGDAPVGRFAYHTLPRRLATRCERWWPHTIDTDDAFHKYVDDLRSAQLRVAVLRRQDFKCYLCEGDLRDGGEATLSRRDNDEPWWFPNTIAVCGKCTSRS